MCFAVVQNHRRCDVTDVTRFKPELSAVCILTADSAFVKSKVTFIVKTGLAKSVKAFDNF